MQENNVPITRENGLMSEQNKAVICRLIDQVWNQRAFDAADEVFAPEAIIYESGVALPGAGPVAVKALIGEICAAFPDIHTTVDDIIAAEDILKQLGLVP
jgi:hypothetical protein